MRIKKLVGDSFLVRPIEQPETTEGGLYIPQVAKDKPQVGRVVARGHGPWGEAKRRRAPARVGDHVLFGRYAGMQIEVGREVLLLLRADDLRAVVEP